MIREIGEIKWLLLPLYPFIILILFGFWTALRFRRSNTIHLQLSMLGLKFEIIATERITEKENQP